LRQRSCAERGGIPGFPTVMMRCVDGLLRNTSTPQRGLVWNWVVLCYSMHQLHQHTAIGARAGEPKYREIIDRLAVRHSHKAQAQARRLPVPHRPTSRDQPLPRRAQSPIEALHLDRRSRQNHRRRQARTPSVRFDPLERGYLFYSQFSADAAHPTIRRALKRHLIEVVENGERVLGLDIHPVERGAEVADTVNIACNAVVDGGPA
jgi:hypothetical protein